MNCLAACRKAWVEALPIMTLPFTSLKQVWADYKLGRDVRKEVARSQYRSVDKYRRDDTDNDKETKKDRLRRSWCLRRGQEYPWRIERDIQGDVNWRATWILEAKDMFDIEWETRRVHDGRKWRWLSVPQGHWPFPYERGGEGTDEYRKDE